MLQARYTQRFVHSACHREPKRHGRRAGYSCRPRLSSASHPVLGGQPASPSNCMPPLSNRSSNALSAPSLSRSLACGPFSPKESSRSFCCLSSRSCCSLESSGMPGSSALLYLSWAPACCASSLCSSRTSSTASPNLVLSSAKRAPLASAILDNYTNC